MKETTFETMIKQMFRVNNITCYSIVGKQGSSGVSDLELVYNGEVFKLELKVKHKLTKNQELYLSLFKNAYYGKLLKNGNIEITNYHTQIVQDFRSFVKFIKGVKND